MYLLCTAFAPSERRVDHEWHLDEVRSAPHSRVLRQVELQFGKLESTCQMEEEILPSAGKVQSV